MTLLTFGVYLCRDVLISATSVTNEEIEQAEEKFEESKQLAEVAMTNLLENEACDLHFSHLILASF